MQVDTRGQERHRGLAKKVRIRDSPSFADTQRDDRGLYLKTETNNQNVPAEMLEQLP